MLFMENYGHPSETEMRRLILCTIYGENELQEKFDVSSFYFFMLIFF